jgi:hypothetical protein
VSIGTGTGVPSEVLLKNGETVSGADADMVLEHGPRHTPVWGTGYKDLKAIFMAQSDDVGDLHKSSFLHYVGLEMGLSGFQVRSVPGREIEYLGGLNGPEPFQNQLNLLGRFAPHNFDLVLNRFRTASPTKSVISGPETDRICKPDIPISRPTEGLKNLQQTSALQ